MDHRISKDMISSGMIPSGEKNQEDLNRTQYGTAPSPSALSDVYKSMYEKKEETLNEHHKKDADGNTIPHEDEELKEGAGLYANIHAKRKRGGKMRKKGAKGAPSSQDFANAAKTAKEEVEIDEAGPLAPLVPLLGKVGTIMKGAKTAAIRTGIKVGGKPGGKFVKSAIKNPLRTAADVSYASNMMPQTSSGKDGTGKTPLATAGVDLFDIVKGQLLDEGLSEEEIRDIMLTLTPDEILKEMEDKPMEVNVADAKANTPAYQNYMKGMKRKTDGKPMYTASQDMKDRAKGLK